MKLFGASSTAIGMTFDLYKHAHERMKAGEWTTEPMVFHPRDPQIGVWKDVMEKPV